MSYDVYLTSRKNLEKERGEADVLNPGPASPATEERKRALSERLMAENPELQPYPFGYAEIARIDGISEAEARERYRHIELDGKDDGNGIQITIFDDHVDITVPYWHAGAAAQSTFEEIWRYLRIIEREMGYVTYDGQLDKLLDLSGDFAAVVARYEGVVAQMPEILASVESQRKRKPWWKFW